MQVTLETERSTTVRGTVELLFFFGARRHPASLGRHRPAAGPGPRSGRADDGHTAAGHRALGEAAFPAQGFNAPLPTR
ncbi:hypothetical protein GCM10007977_059650 [Dactylosporangium sucinum]|uniref:Uncharacterized protein n=1 Tax=Dactylosporangium sucinum TaxID=1424081 RepID=A0A917X0U4_9ACTN|nr:hypothetical protein GCM10007977_059650 [Dactylosporangium sucinum]